jgi:hypothetical protein
MKCRDEMYMVNEIIEFSILKDHFQPDDKNKIPKIQQITRNTKD